MYWRLLRSLLFLGSPEATHETVMRLFAMAYRIPGVAALLKKLFCVQDKRLERQVIGLTFHNPVGLAAGFDKDARWFNELACLGFGFLEIGTVTPLAQPGNEPPRLFRLPTDDALINRMGFNNAGSAAAAQQLRQRRENIIIGGNIGKNKDTANEQALHDYLQCFHDLHEVVDYFVVNVSSPNTPGLRELQDKEPLRQLLEALMQANQRLPRPKPILLKIAPDLSETQLDDIIDLVRETHLAGVVATNTTVARQGLATPPAELDAIGAGGLSGKPLTDRATDVIRYLAAKSQKSFAIIGVGGIHTPQDAVEKLQAGADLVQIYTGFVYAGPGLAKHINQYLLQ